jgi:hypothetical protein
LRKLNDSQGDTMNMNDLSSSASILDDSDDISDELRQYLPRNQLMTSQSQLFLKQQQMTDPSNPTNSRGKPKMSSLNLNKIQTPVRL